MLAVRVGKNKMTLTLNINKSSVSVGESVVFSGVLSGVGNAGGQRVAVYPHLGDVYPVVEGYTDASGHFSLTWVASATFNTVNGVVSAMGTNIFYSWCGDLGEESPRTKSLTIFEGGSPPLPELPLLVLAVSVVIIVVAAVVSFRERK